MSLLYQKQVNYRCEFCKTCHDTPREAILCFYHDAEKKYGEGITFILYEGVVYSYGYGSTPNYVYTKEVYRGRSIDGLLQFAKDNHLKECTVKVSVEVNSNYCYYGCHLEELLEDVDD